LLFPLVLLGICGFVSGIINGNSLSVTILGTFDYLKNFAVIFIYAAFFKDFNGFKKLFRLLLFIALLLGTIALIQFIWAMGSVYILGKAITDKSIYIFHNMPGDNIDIVWRYGIFRTSSHPYVLGLFNLLILTIYFYTARKLNIKVFFLLLSGIIASVSRMAYGGLIVVMSMQLFKVKKWLIPLLLITLVVLIYINNILNLSEPTNGGDLDFNNVRLYSRYKSIEIWKDHPFMGVGPGIFGGIVSLRPNSHIYAEYNFRETVYINKVGSIEQFWFQIMPEMGIIGALLFINFIIFLFITLYKLREQAMSQDMKNLFSALIVFIPCILIYTIGSGINIAPVLFTYCAFVGMGVGSMDYGVGIMGGK
jgi:hypothetical protein